MAVRFGTGSCSMQSKASQCIASVCAGQADKQQLGAVQERMKATVKAMATVSVAKCKGTRVKKVMHSEQKGPGQFCSSITASIVQQQNVLT